MAEKIEDIRQRKLEELRSRAESEPETEPTTSTPSTPVQISGQAALTETVDEHDVVLADFYADWCGPCQMLEPTVETIAADTAATVAKVDIDANQQLAAQYGVRSVPTLVLFADGQPVERLVGMQDESRLRAAVETHT
ncbi:thioredoxin [Salarchaeum sp. JOR-1]|uniref:thioredoxin n=1 Tax=Salarchaeum sp. JOR-1 TaxID=2599399 RepID=UPI0011986C82|nr:thioredoxin [Salarchaeum sp. JOR-1]QDX39395.1 thioredoxin [Salarchaeum sp. JOR-1]